MRSIHGSVALIFSVGFGLSVALACGGPDKPSETPLGGTDTAAPTDTGAPTSTGGETPPETTASATGTGEAPPPAAPAWKDMTTDQKKDVMKNVVVPKMTALFQEHDAKKFKDVGCGTCHGPGAKEGKFDMPNAKLPKLDPKDGFAKHKKKDAKMVAFMMEKVVPGMVEALKVQPFNPETKEGFGCGNCHVMVGAAATGPATKPAATPAKTTPPATK